MSLADGQLTMAETARAAGGWVWAERSLFEVAGRWVRTTAAPAAKLFFDSASQHHAWRARLWEQELGGRLVQSYGPGPGPEEVSQPFSPASRALVEVLGSLEGDVERMAAYARVVLARTVCEYRWWQGKLSPVSDRPLARVIGFALADASADWAEANSVLTRLLGGAGRETDPIGRAGVAVADVERAVMGEGLVFGG